MGGSGGTARGGTTGAGGANAGGDNAGGVTSNGGATSNGGTSAGGSIGNGGTSAGGVVGNGGTSAGGAVGNGGVSAGGAVGNGGATSSQSGDCAIGADDCHNGTSCVEVTPGGYRVCAVKVPEVNGCTVGVSGCCSSSECQGGRKCYASPLAPNCSGAVIIDNNVCASDTCTSDSACGANGICAPAGTFMRKVAMCVPAACRHDTDCTGAPGGICAPVSGGCCDIPYGLYCVYPNKGCRSNADCQTGNCALDPQGFSVCSSSPLICPL
jgi:hypothetical protein